MNRIRSTLTIVALLAMAGPAIAQEGIILGGSLGYAQYKDTCERANVPCDERDDQAGPLFGATHDAITDSGFTYGAGLGYTLWRIGLRAEWQRYQNVGNSINEEDIDVFSLERSLGSERRPGYE